MTICGTSPYADRNQKTAAARAKPDAARLSHFLTSEGYHILDPSLDPTSWHGLLSLRIDPHCYQPECRRNPHHLLLGRKGRDGGSRISRPPRSTAPAPLHPNGGEGLPRRRREHQAIGLGQKPNRGVILSTAASSRRRGARDAPQCPGCAGARAGRCRTAEFGLLVKRCRRYEIGDILTACGRSAPMARFSR